MTNYDENMKIAERKAAIHEPQPTGNGHVVVTELLKDLLARDGVGQKKYGTSLQTDNGRDALNDALQEALDLCMYLKQAIMERDILAEKEKIEFSMRDLQNNLCNDTCDDAQCSCSECDRDYISNISKRRG